MATYKVIQDIEAEDHIIGPLSLRQFIYALATGVFLYASYFVVSRHAAVLLILFLPPALFAGFFAWPWSRDQPTEIWAVAKLRFLFKPRRRIWDQSGVKELVTVTAPRRVQENLTNGLSQMEVHSRLSALASTIDSRGWAIKNVNLNMYSQPSLLGTSPSDRLIDPSIIPQEVPNYDIQAADDIMDEQNNPVAQQFDQLIRAQAQSHRQQLINQLNAPAGTTPAATMPTPPQNYWFLEQPVQPPQLPKDQSVFAKAQVVMPGGNDAPQEAVPATPIADEAALSAELKAHHDQPAAAYGHMRTIQPIDASRPAPAKPAPPSTPAPDPAKIDLARRDDLNVATIARIANKQDEPPEDEVVISLH